MKPFNLEEALKGAPLITRDGKYKNVILRNVIIGAKYPLISEIVNLDGSLSHQSYYLNGKLTKDEEFDKDLFMKEDSDLEEKNEEFYTTNNPESFKDQLFDILKKSPNNLIKKDFGKEKIVNFRYLLECVVETDLENEKINFIDCLKEKIFWHPNGIKIVEEVKICDHCHEANQNLLYKIQRMEEEIKNLEEINRRLRYCVLAGSQFMGFEGCKL